MTKIFMVITNTGDGANGIKWVKDSAVISKMRKLAAEGDETYASGDGLQVSTLEFPDSFYMDGWVQSNSIEWTCMEDLV